MTARNITVVGDGAMATVCAMLLDGNGHRVTMWGPFAEHVEQVEQTRRNERYLPGYELPASLKFTAEEGQALKDAQFVVSAMPTQYIRSVWERFAPHWQRDLPVVSVAKGIENATLLSPTQIIADVIAKQGATRRTGSLAALSGPSIAAELARCLPATVCVSSEDEKLGEELQQIFTTHWFRVYTNNDLLGVELAGATKNVIALAAGIVDGLSAGYNAKSALLSRGLAEITRLGVAMGAQAETFFGIAGVGDLATTCFSPEGRNRSAGELLGKGMKLDAVLEQVRGVVEGVPTTRSVMELASRHNVEMPITAAVNDVLFKSLDPIQAITQLMTRSPKREVVG